MKRKMCKNETILMNYKMFLIRMIKTSPAQLKSRYMDQLINLIEVECDCWKGENAK